MTSRFILLSPIVRRIAFRCVATPSYRFIREDASTAIEVSGTSRFKLIDERGVVLAHHDDGVSQPAQRIDIRAGLQFDFVTPSWM
jgi:hypothetical protein